MMMREALIDLGLFFRREKIYLFFLLVIIAVYGYAMSTPHEVPAGEGSQRLYELENALRDSSGPEMIRQRLIESPVLSIFLQLFTICFIGMFLFGVFLDYFALRRLMSRKELLPGVKPLGQARWGIDDVARVTILFFVISVSLNIVWSVVHYVFPSKGDIDFVMLVHALIIDSLAVGLMVWGVRRTGGELHTLLGFRFPRIPWRELWVGISGYMAILPVFLLLVVLLVMIANFFTFEPEPHPLVRVFVREDGRTASWMIGLSIFLACIIGPVVEEVFFRGFLYPALKKYMNWKFALVISAAAFSGVHENIFSFLPIFLLGLALGYVYEKRRNVAACVSLHVLHNSVFIAYFFILKALLTNG